ncbi:hypothetical protein JCM18899A_44300 [Nocardioides sp. AN3]
MSRFPCPCCGHLTLPQGPGDYELCPICFWEDDGGQLRYPLSPDGANGISLAEAQQVYRRLGAMDQVFKRKVRKPRQDEPVDEGWRPFDPDLDWTVPALDDDRWPVNTEALYYWRPTYWNGDQHRLPLPAREPTNDDRFVAHLRAQVPELREAIAASERRWGVAGAFDVCHAAARRVLTAYQEGDDQLALSIVTALLPAVDEGSAMYSPNCVSIAFLEHEGWHNPATQDHVDTWPAPIRDDLRAQQAYRRHHDATMVLRRESWTELHRTGHGQPIDEIAARLRALPGQVDDDDPETELGLQVTARVISDRFWLYRHPIDSFRLAWRYRATRRPWRTIGALRRPRFVVATQTPTEP